MSDISMSIKLTPKEAGKLYVSHEKRGQQIKEMRVALERIVALAEESKDFTILTAAKAGLEA